jgi:hypothetical protein
MNDLVLAYGLRVNQDDELSGFITEWNFCAFCEVPLAVG